MMNVGALGTASGDGINRGRGLSGWEDCEGDPGWSILSDLPGFQAGQNLSQLRQIRI